MTATRQTDGAKDQSVARPGTEQVGHEPSREAALASLQSAVGNSAFSALVQRKGGTPVAIPPTGAPVVQRDLVDKAKAKLSVSGLTKLFGAKVSPEDATAAMKLLAQLPANQLGGAITRLGDDRIEVLLTLLPDSQKKGGFIDLLLALPQAKLDGYLAKIPKGEASSAGQKQQLKDLFTKCPNTRLPVLKSVMAIRFDLAIGGATTAAAAGETAIDWEPLGLRRMYPVLEALPPAHVSQNKRLISMGRYQDTGVSGYYWKDEGAIGYDVAGLSHTQSSESGGKKDPLHGVNRFDKVVRHEVGHAVDARTKWSSKQAKNNEFGGWTDYGADTGKAFDAMFAASTGGIKDLRKARQADLVGVFKWVMANKAPDKLNEKIMALSWWDKASQNTINQITNDKIYQTLQVAFANPWYNATDGGIDIGGYIYQQSYPTPQWTRYKSSARSKKVSQYQFRAPGEWFAEAYAAYYEPSKKKGEVLAKTDSSSKEWFDKNIDGIAASR